MTKLTDGHRKRLMQEAADWERSTARLSAAHARSVYKDDLARLKRLAAELRVPVSTVVRHAIRLGSVELAQHVERGATDEDLRARVRLDRFEQLAAKEAPEA